jgi:hypothetical protein
MTGPLARRFRQHRDHVRGVAYRMLGSHTDAEDAVQETWLRLASVDAHDIATWPPSPRRRGGHPQAGISNFATSWARAIERRNRLNPR